MKKRKIQPRASSKSPSLRALDDEEMQFAYERARLLGRLHEPHNLRTVWEQRKKMVGPVGVKELVQIIRAGAASPNLDDPQGAANYLALLLQMAVERFECLLKSGAVDDVLPRLNALPLLYSPKAGKGAPEWKWARDLFESKKVGTDAVSSHRGSDYAAARDAHWGLLAADAAKLATWAAIELPSFDSLKAQAVAVGHKVARRAGAHYGWRGHLYLLADESVIIWPHWFDLCRGLPRTVKEDVPRYKKACEAMAKEFFGDPGNTYGEALLAAKTTSNNAKTRARARLEAVQSIVSAVGRLGGWKR